MRRHSSILTNCLAWSVVPAVALALAACADREATTYPAEDEGIYEEPPPAPPPQQEAEPEMEPMEEWPPPTEPPDERGGMDEWPEERSEGEDIEEWPAPDEGAAGEEDW
jgi:hypothetical protein